MRPVTACAQTDDSIAERCGPLDSPPCDCDCQTCHDGRITHDDEGEPIGRCPACRRTL